MHTDRNAASCDARTRTCRGDRPASDARHPRNALGGFATIFILAAPAFAAAAPAHPRLMIQPEDLAAIRHACGTERDDKDLGQFGARRDVVHLLRIYFAQSTTDVLLPGEPLAVAFLHLATRSDEQDRARLQLIESALRQPLIEVPDVLELLIAVDWTWDALDPARRVAFLNQLREGLAPLSPRDSPLRPGPFRRKLIALAAAVIYDEDAADATWALERRQILDAARAYADQTLPGYLAARGLIPTSSAAAATEERDTVLAVALLDAARRIPLDEYAAVDDASEPLWDQHTSRLGRLLEHYLFTDAAAPGARGQFLHDDSAAAPPTPAPEWRSLLPLTAPLLAGETNSPAARLVAQRVERDMLGADDPLALLWRWTGVAFGIDAAASPLDRARLPRARNLDGAVIFRAPHGNYETLIWIDAGQRFLRERQHFDAGSFQVRIGGMLVGEAGDDIVHDAVFRKRGKQRLGDSDEPFDFDIFFAASIAHNTMLFTDLGNVPQWRGERYDAIGGQTPLEATCTDFVSPLSDQGRTPAALSAFGCNEWAAYAAIDLRRAYDRRTLDAYTREFVLVGDQTLLIIDRFRVAHHRAAPTWVLQLPTRPRINAAPLAAADRTAGKDNDAGIWRPEQVEEATWVGGDGVAALVPLLPEDRLVSVVGGPAERKQVTLGRFAGLSYLGGSPDGFERLVTPSRHGPNQNAWYELGEPTVLGPAVGRMPQWGRIEIDTPEPARRIQIWIQAIILRPLPQIDPPQIALAASDDGAKRVVIRDADNKYVVTLTADDGTGGVIERISAAGASEAWSLPTGVAPQGPLLAKPAD